MANIIKAIATTSLQKKLNELNLTHEALARHSGINRVQISGYCRGKDPGLKNARKIAKALGETIDALFPDSDEVTQ